MQLDHATAADLDALPPTPPALDVVLGTLAEVLRPRPVVAVSAWADEKRWVSTKASQKAGQWRTDRNELLREPMDAFTRALRPVDVTLKFPIQLGKTEAALNVIGYSMCENPGPLMAVLPAEASMRAWVSQKLGPMLEESEAVAATLTSRSSREAANRFDFKDYTGGQLFIEHAGSTARLKSKSIRTLVVDELDEFVASLQSGDDPVQMLDGRTSGFPHTAQRLYISSPQIKGSSRIDEKWLAGDMRRRYLPCPHCGHMQYLQWEGLRWSATRHPVHGRRAWYVCQECGAEIDEHHKAAMLRAGRWIPTNPLGAGRSYHANCLYYAPGLGPSWASLVEEYLAAVDDPAKLKTFTNDRLAEAYEDGKTARLKQEAIADRAESYPLRTAPDGVLWVTVGVDTQDDRLEVHFIGWGRWPAWWAIDYVVLWGNPAESAVWDALTTLLTTPIQHAWGCTVRPDAYAHDIAGHHQEDVKAYIRRARMRGIARPLAIFGATQANAPILGRGKAVDITWRGNTERAGLHIHAVGTVAAKHQLFNLLGADADRDERHRQQLQAEEAAARAEGRPTKPVAPAVRHCHISTELPERYLPGLLSEQFDAKTGRYVKKRGARNEPLDTWVYAFVAAHHPELRLHRMTEADIARRTLELRHRASLATDAAIVPSAPAAGPIASAAPTDPTDQASPPAASRTSAQAAPGAQDATPAADRPPAEPAVSPSLAALLAARRNRSSGRGR